MATETEQLVYELQARIDKFQQNFDQATQTANDSFEKMESRGKAAGNRMSDSIKTATASVADSFNALQGPVKNASNMIGALIGGGVIAGVAGFATTMQDLINTLAKAGDRADDLRLPVNIIQALSVAADRARVPTDTLNSALDQFTSVSKKTVDNAKDLGKALSNIDPSLVKAFQSAPTQVERLRVIMDAFTKSTDEIKRAQLSQEAFGTSNERLISMMSGGRDALADYIEEIRKLGLEIDESAVKKAQEAKSALSLLSRVMTDELSSALAELIPSFKELLPYLEAVAAHVRDSLAGFASPENRPLATLKNDAKAAEDRLADLEGKLKQLDSYKPSGGLLGEAGKLFGTDIYTAQDKSGDIAGVGLGVEAVRKSITDQIAQTQAQLEKFRTLIAEKQKLQDASRGKDGTEAPAFKPRPKLNDDSDSKSIFDGQINRINRHIAALNAEATAVGLTKAASQGLWAELALLQAAQRDDDDITEAQIDNYAKLRSTMNAQQAMTAAGIKLNKDDAKAFAEVTTRISEAAQRLDSAKAKFAGANDALKYAGNELVDVLDRASQRGSNFGTIMQDVLRSVERQLLQAAIVGDGAFAKLFGTASTTGGVGGILGGLFNMFGGARADGGPVDAGRAYLVGEKRPEIFVPKGPGMILPSAAIGGTSVNQQNTAIHIKVAGSSGTPSQNADLAQKIAQAMDARVRQLSAGELRRAMRPGGLLSG